MIKRILVLALAMYICFNISGQNRYRLAFNKEGKFKIAQFTDIHWIDGSPNCARTDSTIKYVLETEKPDVAILTGDVAWNVPSRKSWRDVSKIFEDARVPFAVVLGNHDTEKCTGVTRDEIFDILSKSSFFIGKKGPDNIYGSGNYVLPVFGKKSTIAALLYCFDSNSYIQNNDSSSHDYFGTYDWIHFDQIEWYRRQSKKFTKQNNNKPLPSLAFFHIPLPEYNEISNSSSTIGHFGESVCSPKVNSGLFGSFVDMQDVKGVFVGHDHDNDFIGLDFNIALAYGRITGFDTYGSLVHGARIIEMEKNQFKFDTWVCTPKGKELFFHYPSGISSVDEENMHYLPAIQAKPQRQGLKYTYYEGKFKSFNDTTGAVKRVNGHMKNISIKEAPVKYGFAYDFNSLIHVANKGVYRFYTISDDHSKLFIDGNPVVDNCNSNGNYAYGKVALEAGFHKLRVIYFQDESGARLDVGFCDKYTAEHLIPASMLFVPE